MRSKVDIDQRSAVMLMRSSVHTRTALFVSFRCAELETVEVRGYQKHATYEPGDKVDTENNKGCWTVVLVDDSWYLMDVHWSSQHVSGVQSPEWELLDNNGKIGAAGDVKQRRRETHYKYDESYFLTSPEEFIYSHYPVDSKWQLLERPVSLEEFTRMAYLKSHFFEYGLQLKNHRQCVEYAPEGMIKIKLGMPPGAVYEFMYKLWISNKGKANTDTHQDKNLKRFVFVEVHKGTLTCSMEFPISGKFKLDLFCNDKAVSDTYFFVCSYVIHAEKAKANARALPENQRSVWGPGHDLEKAGLRPITHKRGMVELDQGETEMRFSAEKDVDVLAQLHSNTRSADAMRGYVVHRLEDQQLILNMKFPEAGDYALNLYAKENTPDSSGAGLPNVCSYVVSTTKPAADPSPYFISGNGQLGPTADFHKLCLKALSQPSAYFEAPQSGQVDCSFDSPIACDIIANLSLIRGKKEQKMEGFTFIDKRKNKKTVKARFPEKGQYMLKVYGKEQGKEGSYPLVFVYLIAANYPMKNCCEFPKAYDAWSEDCELAEPDIGKPLLADQTIQFAVRVPGAHGVATIHPSAGWTHFTQDENDLWTADVNTGPQPGAELKLSANFSPSSNSFETMLIFKIQKLTEARQVQRSQSVAVDSGVNDSGDERRRRRTTTGGGGGGGRRRGRDGSKRRRSRAETTQAEREERRREEMERREQEEEWKRQYLEQERRKEMGEWEWRRQQYRERQPALQSLSASQRLTKTC